MEPVHEIMVLFVLRKLILQTPMRSHPVGLDVWFLVGPFTYSILHVCEQQRIAWTFVGHLCDKYHNLMSWLNGIWWSASLLNKGDRFFIILQKYLKQFNIFRLYNKQTS